MRSINIESIQKNAKDFYETCTEISVLQKQLEQMLCAIEKNSKEFQKGNISKNLFSYNEKKLKNDSAVIIRKVNSLVKHSEFFIAKISREVESQKTAPRKFSKKKKISEIKNIVKKEDAPAEAAKKEQEVK
jgi:hypothetical protein